MIRMLTVDEILEVVQTSPEQAVFDWKADFVLPNDPEKQGEFLKDLAAIANGITLSPGFIVYGVDPRKPDPVIGTTTAYDDSRLQQLVKNKILPAVEFVYYEVMLGAKRLAVVQVQPTRKRPHIIAVDLGKVRNGQIPIRRGSATDGAKLEDLVDMFYGKQSEYFANVLGHMALRVKQQQADTAQFLADQQHLKDLERQMNILAGLPPNWSG